MPFLNTLRRSTASCATTWLLLAAGQSSTAFAQQGPPQPPAQALAACQKLAAGAACSFSGERGTATGACWAPEGKPLACKPANGNGNGAPPTQK